MVYGNALDSGGADTSRVTETRVKRADAPELLEFDWGGGGTYDNWSRLAAGTRLTSWPTSTVGSISMGAPSWRIFFDVLDRLLAGPAHWRPRRSRRP